MIEPRPFIPRNYQHIIVDHIIDTPRCGVWAGMGLGKTASVLQALSVLDLVDKVFPALVVAPLRVAQSTWPDEVKKWSDFRHLTVVPIIGDEETRASRVRHATGKRTIATINYENIPWLIEHLNGAWPFKVIVSDESTRLKGHRLKQGTKRAQYLSKVAHTKGSRFIELTGTPSPNGLNDLWGQIHFLDQGVRLGRSYDGFKQRWFQRAFDDYGVVPLPFAQKEIEERLKDICVSLKAEDYFPLEKPIEIPVYIDLPPLARRKYNDMEKQMYAELEGIGIEAFNAASRTNKCLQMANGAAYIISEEDKAKGKPPSEWIETHSLKLEALESIIEEAAGMPVLVSYNFRSDLARLLKHFPKGRHLDKDPQTIADWNAGKIPVMFAHPASAGHGLNLQDGGNILVHFAHDWNLENYMQIMERIGPTRQYQAGHKRNVFVYHIIARNTVEELVMERIETKRSVQDLLMEAMKRRKQ